MDASFIQAMEVTALPASILCGTAIVGLVKWAKAQKAVESNATLDTVLTYVEDAAQAIVASLKTLPEGANVNTIRNTIIQEAADNLMSSQHLLLKKANIGKPALMAMIDTRVISHGSGTVVKPDTLKMAMPPVKAKAPLSLYDSSNQFATTDWVQRRLEVFRNGMVKYISDTQKGNDASADLPVGKLEDGKANLEDEKSKLTSAYLKASVEAAMADKQKFWDNCTKVYDHKRVTEVDGPYDSPNKSSKSRSYSSSDDSNVSQDCSRICNDVSNSISTSIATDIACGIF